MNNFSNSNIDKDLIKLIYDYCNSKLTLFDFETNIINFTLNNVSEQTEDLIAEIQEDIAYTTIGNLTQEDRQNKLMSENELKQRLKDYLQ